MSSSSSPSLTQETHEDSHWEAKQCMRESWREWQTKWKQSCVCDSTTRSIRTVSIRTTSTARITFMTRVKEDTKKIPMTKITRRRQRDILSDQVHLQETHLVFSHVFAFCVFRVSCFLRRYLFPSTLRVVTEEEKGSMSRGRRMVQKSWEGSRGRLWQQRRRTTDNSHEKEHLSQDSILMVSIQRERTTNKRKRVRW